MHIYCWERIGKNNREHINTINTQSSSAYYIFQSYKFCHRKQKCHITHLILVASDLTRWYLQVSTTKMIAYVPNKLHTEIKSHIVLPHINVFPINVQLQQTIMRSLPPGSGAGSSPTNRDSRTSTPSEFIPSWCVGRSCRTSSHIILNHGSVDNILFANISYLSWWTLCGRRPFY